MSVACVPVSWFRLGIAEARASSARLLAGLDSMLQRSGWMIAPSVFLELGAKGRIRLILESPQRQPIRWKFFFVHKRVHRIAARKRCRLLQRHRNSLGNTRRRLMISASLSD